MTSNSLSIKSPSLSPTPYLFTTTTSPTASASCSSSSSFSLKVSSFSSSRAKPICLNCKGVDLFRANSERSGRRLQGVFVKANSNSNMTITEVREEEEPLLDAESQNNSRPRRIALFVEPSPFAKCFVCYGSGY